MSKKCTYIFNEVKLRGNKALMEVLTSSHQTSCNYMLGNTFKTKKKQREIPPVVFVTSSNQVVLICIIQHVYDSHIIVCDKSHGLLINS